MLCERFHEQTDSLRKKYQFELFRIEEQQKTELEILKAEYHKSLEVKSQEILSISAELEKWRSLEQSKMYEPISFCWTRDQSAIQ